MEGQPVSCKLGAVAVNRHREVGIVILDLSAPHEIIVVQLADSHHFFSTLSLLRSFQVIR